MKKVVTCIFAILAVMICCQGYRICALSACQGSAIECGIFALFSVYVVLVMYRTELYKLFMSAALMWNFYGVFSSVFSIIINLNVSMLRWSYLFLMFSFHVACACLVIILAICNKKAKLSTSRYLDQKKSFSLVYDVIALVVYIVASFVMACYLPAYCDIILSLVFAGYILARLWQLVKSGRREADAAC